MAKQSSFLIKLPMIASSLPQTFSSNAFCFHLPTWLVNIERHYLCNSRHDSSGFIDCAQSLALYGNLVWL